MPFLRTLIAMTLAAGFMLVPTRSIAAESYDNCNNFIDSLPATISTQGVWCLRKDLATAITSGAAIRIDANNVTIDCNDFKVGGLAAGNSSAAFGIYSDGKQNVTIRNCGVRGFYTGIQIGDGSGHLIENNRLDYNLVSGISLHWNASNSAIRNNRVFDTGGYPSPGTRYGIFIYAQDSVEVDSNVIAGVYGTPGQGNSVTGLHRQNLGGRVISRITNNAISSLVATETGTATGYYHTNSDATGSVTFTGNHLLLNSSHPGSIGARCFYSNNVIARDNTIIGFATGMDSACYDAGGNVTL